MNRAIPVDAPAFAHHHGGYNASGTGNGAMARKLTATSLAIGLLIGMPALAQDSTPGRPVTNPGTWISAADYPASALRNAEQGAVHFALTYDTTGMPTTCEVTASSGSSQLDDTTCRILMARARFVPGTKHGKPVGDTFRSSINWRLPGGGGGNGLNVVPAPTKQQMAFVVGADGKVLRCEASENGGGWHEVAPGTGLISCPVGKRFAPAKDTTGRTVAKRVTVTFTIAVDDAS
ncbi:TonB family protein [Novosphingobium capsulatum]|uniref:TonB family protein n=1 Tax=Novosphingobium capsulatum TaxID=13688 RepID=A0ABU1MI76_9SPHN|nr:energy transducer TonB [Novosphingobium capsulatum]MDR6509617.1 TonB family protein [Novosphingobium capsulatum]